MIAFSARHSSFSQTIQKCQLWQVQHAPPAPTGHLLLGRSLNFCSCTTWFLDFDDSVRINRAWLYKDPKVLALQAIASVAQEGAWWTWNLRAWTLFPLGVIFCYWTFWFSCSKDKNATIGISVHMWITLLCTQIFQWSKKRLHQSLSRNEKASNVHVPTDSTIIYLNFFLLPGYIRDKMNQEDFLNFFSNNLIHEFS